MIKRLSKFHKICSEWWPPYEDPRINLKTFFFQPMHKLVLEHIANRSTESFHATAMLFIPQTSNFAVSLTLKTKAVAECFSLYPASDLTETVNLQTTKSKFKTTPFKPSICDQFV